MFRPFGRAEKRQPVPLAGEEIGFLLELGGLQICQGGLFALDLIVVDIFADPDHPVQGLEQGDIGDLGVVVTLASRLQPGIAVETAPPAGDDLQHVSYHRAALVRKLQHRHALKGRIKGKELLDPVEIEGEKVASAGVVAHITQRLAYLPCGWAALLGDLRFFTDAGGNLLGLGDPRAQALAQPPLEVRRHAVDPLDGRLYRGLKGRALFNLEGGETCLEVLFQSEEVYDRPRPPPGGELRTRRPDRIGIPVPLRYWVFWPTWD